jgi:hypothetical protein
MRPLSPVGKYGLYCATVQHADANIRAETGINKARAE